MTHTETAVVFLVAFWGLIGLFATQHMPLIRRWFGFDPLKGLDEEPQVYSPRRMRTYTAAKRRFWVQAFVTVVVLLAALSILVFDHEAETSLKDFCYTSIGTIIGFWLKG